VALAPTARGTSPDGLTSFYFGPEAGRRHDSYVLARSDLEEKLRALCEQHGRDWHVYGDSAFTLTRHIQTGFRPSSNPSESNALYTYLMNSGRIAVEWGYGKVTSKWKYLDYNPQLKLHSSPLGSLYRVATCLMNMKICLEGCLTTSYFQCVPCPTPQRGGGVPFSWPREFLTSERHGKLFRMPNRSMRIAQCLVKIGAIWRMLCA